MLVLAEAESLASYGRKRLALSYEKPEKTLIPKSHSPNEHNMSWYVEGAVSELENFPPNLKINWSATARKYNISGKNAGQILKEMAKKHKINTTTLDQRDNTPRIRRRKRRLPGGEISMARLPTVHAVKEEKNQLILSGQLSIGEPCAPYSISKSIYLQMMEGLKCNQFRFVEGRYRFQNYVKPYYTGKKATCIFLLMMRYEK